MASIFDLNRKMQEFQRTMAEEGELPEDVIRDTLESLEGEITDKLKDYAAVIKNLQSDVEGMKKVERTIADRRKMIENRIDQMRQVMDETMQANELEEIDDWRFKIGYRKNPPAAEIVDEDELPDYLFVPQNPTVDKRTLLQLLKDGETIPGARLVTDKRSFYIK